MGADLVLALKRSKEHLPLLATNIRHHVDTNFSIVESSNREASSFGHRWSKLLKWCVHERL
jgi:hypothetical protein